MSSNNIVNFKTLPANVQKLIWNAVEARKLAYSIYSKFAVGACLECEDGTYFTGCNVENQVLGLSICAERTAIVKAVSEGKRKYKSIAVIGDQANSFTTPCGSCRQFMTEFGTNIRVYVTRPSLGEVLVTSVAELLPYMCDLTELKLE